MSLLIGSSGDLYHHFYQLRCFKRVMLTFRELPPVTGKDTPLTPEQLEKRVLDTLRDYCRDCDDYIPMLGVVAPSKKNTAYWHIHLLLQRQNRSEDKPLVDPDLLEELAKKRWLIFKLSNHPKLRDSDDETDLPEYVAGHAERLGAKVLTGAGVRTNFSKHRDQTGTERRAAGPSGRLMTNSRRTSPTPQELAKKQRAAEQRACPVYQPRRTPGRTQPVPMQTSAQAAPRRRELSAGTRTLLASGQVVMTLPRSRKISEHQPNHKMGT